RALDRAPLAGRPGAGARLRLSLEERVGNVDVARLGSERPHEHPVGRHDDEEGEPPGLRPEAALAPVRGALRRRAIVRWTRHGGNTGTAMQVPEGVCRPATLRSPLRFRTPSTRSLPPGRLASSPR